MKKFTIKNIIMYTILVILAIAFFFPLFWIILTAFKPNIEIIKYPPSFFFSPTIMNFFDAISQTNITKALTNSLLVALGSLFVALLIGIPAAYALARYNLPKKNAITMWILGSRFAPPMAFLIPIYVMFSKLGLRDTLGGLIIAHVLLNLALMIWVLKSFIEDIPYEIEQAALVDGCSRLGIIWYIVLPLLMNGILSVSIIGFMFSWNDLLFNVVLSFRLKTAPFLIFSFIDLVRINWGTLSAATLIVMIPCVIFIVFTQKYLARGLALGSIK